MDLKVYNMKNQLRALPRNLLVTVACITGLLGCSTKAYPGADRQHSELSTISLHAIGRVTVQRIEVDGAIQSVNDLSSTVLPGAHSIVTAFRLALYECPMFSVGCADEIVSGICKIGLVTNAGANYDLNISSKEDKVVVEVLDNDDQTTSATASCEYGKMNYQGGILKRRSTIEQ